MKTIEMKALRVKTIFESVGEKVESGKITIREAAIILHKAGWTNYIDIDITKKLLGLN
ncbi:hypothetical protein [Bacteroides timonensis]|jgi:hypothetical protein|uniref:hypothetical protein n=1 Tax=Bacteroides timonensis TaxID=1470345 RepID=UPI001427C3F4|nr:hypothetical protein [Bacteroides timonensis]